MGVVEVKEHYRGNLVVFLFLLVVIQIQPGLLEALLVEAVGAVRGHQIYRQIIQLPVQRVVRVVMVTLLYTLGR
ncbi:MAG: hypothetical protein EBQ92_13370 [Proteobacteria bacterium]|nr:hypothetical protein [Pseudomonadota bacterium]